MHLLLLLCTASMNLRLVRLRSWTQEAHFEIDDTRLLVMPCKACVYQFVCVCIQSESESVRESARAREPRSERERESVCLFVCVFVCVFFCVCV
jgi:hypothetical protein